MSRPLFYAALVGAAAGFILGIMTMRMAEQIRQQPQAVEGWELKDAKREAQARRNDYTKVTGVITGACGTEVFMPHYSHTSAVRVIDKSQMSAVALKCLDIYKGIGWITE